MSSVGVFGLLFGLLASMFAFVQPTRLRITMFASSYLLHVAAAVAYYKIVESGGGDARFYYEDPGRFYDSGFGFNTSFIIYIVQTPKYWFGGSFLDYSLVFQSVGFWGIAFLMRIFEEAYHEAGVEQPVYVYLILFLPSLHYWTSAVGKDGLFFLAISAALWASMHFRRRIVVLAFALLIMMVIRSHIALLAIGAFALTVLIDRRTSIAVRLLLFVLGLAAAALAVRSVWTTFRLDITNVDTISGILAGPDQAAFESGEAGNTAVNATYPIRLLSLLFRPFFLDAPNALGFVVSLENLLQLVITGMLIFRLKTVRAVVKAVPFARYALVSSAGITLALAIGYYNVGLGIRQEATMILPGILVLFVAVRAVIDAEKAQATQYRIRMQRSGTPVLAGQGPS